MLLPRAPRLLRPPGREIKKRSFSRKKHCTAFILQPCSPKNQKKFFQRCPAGQRFFLPGTDRLRQGDISVVSNFARLLHYWYISWQISGIVNDFTFCVQQNHANFPMGYKNIAILGCFSDSLLQFLCNLLKYTCCTVFSLKFIHFGKDVKTAPNTSAIFVRFLRASLQFTSFFLRDILLS